MSVDHASRTTKVLAGLKFLKSVNLVPRAFPLKKWVGREKPWGRGRESVLFILRKILAIVKDWCSCALWLENFFCDFQKVAFNCNLNTTLLLFLNSIFIQG